MDESPWYWRNGASAEGPLDTDALRRCLRSGQIPISALIARPGWVDWRRAGDVFPDLDRAPEPWQGSSTEKSPSSVPPTDSVGPAGAAPQEGDASECIALQCVAGPDAGRSFWVGPGAVRLDRQAGLSDPDIGALWLAPCDGRVQLRVEAGPGVEIAGRTMREAMLAQGARFRFGQSLWCVGTSRVRPEDLLRILRERLAGLASVEHLEGFSLGGMFSDVVKPRTADEIDEYFLVGTAKTTPPIEEVATGWPKPWLFARILLFLGLVYFGFFVAFRQFENARLLPGLLLMGSTAVPFGTLVLFYELNAPRNVSFRAVLSLFFMGGIVSLFVSLLGFDLLDLHAWLGASSAGIIEEIGKLVAVVLVARSVKHRYILNGMLFGAAVGAGFAGFETAGYAAEAVAYSFDLASSMIVLRALLTPFCHVPWTAFSAGVLWRVRGERRFALSMVADASFLKAFTIPVGLHMLWNSPLAQSGSLAVLVRGLVGVVGWYAVFGLVQQGLRQVRDEQEALTRRQITATQVSMRVSLPPEATVR